MKKVIFAVIAYFLFLPLIVQAETYLGKVGPYSESESEVGNVRIDGCDQFQNELYFYVEKNGKYHIPRIKIDTLVIVYDSGDEVIFSGQGHGLVRGFTVELDRSKGCPRSLSLRATAGGINPGRSNASYVEIWMR